MTAIGSVMLTEVFRPRVDMSNFNTFKENNLNLIVKNRPKGPGWQGNEIEPIVTVHQS